MTIKRKLITLITALFLLAMSGYTGYSLFYETAKAKESNYTEQKEMVVKFFTSLAEKNYETLKDVAAGKVLYNAVSHKDSTDGAEIMELAVNIKEYSDNLFKAEAIVELKIEEKINIHCYEVYAVNSGGWKVYRLKETDPPVAGNKIKEKAVKKAEKLFRNYIECLTENSYEQAANYLVGPAKRAHLDTMQIFDGKGLIKEFKGMSFRPLSAGEKTLVLQAEYEADGRRVSVITTLYLTVEGWRIYSVTQV